jgi:Sporulation factor SpoIIGA.
VLAFFYNGSGDKMKVYIDLLLIFNFIIDFLLLISVATILKRRVSFYRIVAGAFVGSFSIFILFIPLSSMNLLLLKIIISIIMILVTFKYKDIKYFLKNISYFYFVSMVLGGGIYLWNTTFAYHNESFNFISNGYQLNFIGLLIISPILIAYYIRKMRTMEEQYNYYYYIDIYYNNKNIKGVGYLDSGNTLTYRKKPVILVNKNKIDFKIDKYELLPYQALNYVGVVKCFKIDYLILNEKKWDNIYLGIMENSFGMDGVDFLLHRALKEG